MTQLLNMDDSAHRQRVSETWDAVHEAPEPIGPRLYWVAAYMIDKTYGGPEEGGWYYTSGDLITDPAIYGEHGQVGVNRDLDQILLPRCFTIESDAMDYCDRLQTMLDKTVNVGRRSISSVLSKGKYQAEIHEDKLPISYPEVKPHYE